MDNILYQLKSIRKEKPSENSGCIIFSVGERKKISPNAKFFAKK